jgi:hypothetical protein
LSIVNPENIPINGENLSHTSALKGEYMKKEKELEFNVKGVSNQKELDKNMKNISDDASKKLKILLSIILAQRKYTDKDLKQIVSLSKWIK